MDVRELIGEPLRVIAVVFAGGDEPIRGLLDVARQHGIDGAHLTAIGAFSSADIGWFDLEQQDYAVTEVREQCEVVSLVGDITLANEAGEEPRVHAHVVLGRRDGRTLGGHLLRATVRPTLEVMVTETPARLRRRHDPATGLALIDLGPTSDTVIDTPGGLGHGPNRR